MGLRTRPAQSTRDDVDELLVEVVRQSEVLPPVAAHAHPDLVQAARFHRIAPLVHVAHRDAAPDVARLFREDRMRAITMHLRSCAALQQLSSALGDVEWVTFKGPVYSEHAHPVPGLRAYNDVDVLVDPSRLRAVSRRLGEAGWRIADYEDMLLNRAVPGEMHWVSTSGVLVDLHWSMINMASRRRLFDVPTADLLHRRVPVLLGTQEAWTLDPADTLVHACLHAALSGANKLIYLVDVDRLSRSITDWDDLADRARQWRAQVQVALVLGRSQRVLGTTFPTDLPSRLRVPRSLQAAMVLTDRVAPVPHGRTNAGLNRFVARAVRASGPATLAAAGRNATRWLGDRRSTPAHGEGPRRGADETALEVYLAAVESAARASVGLGPPPSAARRSGA
ncbi:nucleotidyltransferase domain-containing protein [Nocardioides xinjiangensis]|uniref:nucleotidyltransferase domain-containing protein n=1 Tax=Nocardioides xinjiangensis TaxID=2817376 RepID=UPI001B30F152|nr:nucleotidyltransferase family protein [Nocardioides sp. SYSU D00514]